MVQIVKLLDAVTITGPQGAQGPQGASGGPQGATGAQGPQGASGSQGNDGAQGPQGVAGNDGPQGVTGAQGPQGTAGNQGAEGPQGATGTGSQGATGAQGPQGATGAQGTTGSGTQGATGAQGPQGFQGNQGATGSSPQTTTYSANAISTTSGTYVSGSVTDIQTFNDGNEYIVDEVIATPGFEVEIDFVSVTSFNNVQLNVAYTNTSGHVVNIDLYNVGTTNWDTIGVFHGLSGFTQFSLGVIDGTPYISSGNVRLRLYHVTLGVNTHDIQVDYCVLQNALQGPQGPQGPQGYQGYQGNQGTQGTTGNQGPQGTQGKQGYQGTQGTTGTQGPQGTQGKQGYQGYQGNQGTQGTQGYQGYQGPQGTSVSSPLPANCEASDHGTAATDMLINVCYGTGAAPTASTTTEGALYLQYTA